MVVLEALKCAQCGEQCKRAWNDGYPYEISACKECDTLICGNCRQNRLSCPRHQGMMDPNYLSRICTFLSYGPEDELRLIDLQIATNVNCFKCNCGTSILQRRGFQQVLCLKCFPFRNNSWEASPITTVERLFRKIVSELSERAMPKTRIQRKDVDGILPVKIVEKCKACKTDLGGNISIMLDGEPHCYSCGHRVYQYFPVSRRCDCLRRLIDFIECIPENQLHLLTYSKWLNAVGCEQHRDILCELNAVSADGTKTGKLRSFFKKEKIARILNIRETSKDLKPTITVKNTAITKDRKQGTSTLSKMDPSIPDKVLPDRITCSCGREDELSNMFDCLTCSTYGVCGLCLGKKHWGHEMKESKKTVTFCLINSQSEATRLKLIEMVGQTKDLNKEGEQSFEKLCEVLGLVFKDAMLSENLPRIQSLLARANTSEIEKNFKNAMNSTRTLYKSMDSFCVDLLNAVEETEKTKPTVKEAPRVDRK